MWTTVTIRYTALPRLTRLRSNIHDLDAGLPGDTSCMRALTTTVPEFDKSCEAEFDKTCDAQRSADNDGPLGGASPAMLL
jgi:hypothetical protein